MFNWDSLYHVFWVSGSTSSSSSPPSPLGPEKHTIYCAEAASALLSMARMVCGKVRDEEIKTMLGGRMGSTYKGTLRTARVGRRGEMVTFFQYTL